MYPAVAALKRERYTIETIDVTDDPDLAQEYRVYRVPTFVYVLDGKEVRRQVGYTSEPGLRRLWRSPSSFF
jgi:thiol-disulfide isomerase/thioredoxin